MAIKIRTDQLQQNIENLIVDIQKAGEEVAKIKEDWTASPEYKDDLLQKAEEKYKSAVKELAESMKGQIEKDVQSVAVKREFNYAEATYHATALNQEISGLNTAQLVARYADIVAEGDEMRKKEFERLAVALMKNNGDETEAQVFQNNIYSNMTEAEKDEVDTRKAGETFLYNVDIIEQQANTFLSDALEGREAKPGALKDIWEQGQANAERTARV